MTSFLNQQRDQDLDHKLRHALRAEKIIETDGEQPTVLVPCSDMRSIGYMFEKNQLQQLFLCEFCSVYRNI